MCALVDTGYSGSELETLERTRKRRAVSATEREQVVQNLPPGFCACSGVSVYWVCTSRSDPTSAALQVVV